MVFRIIRVVRMNPNISRCSGAVCAGMGFMPGRRILTLKARFCARTAGMRLLTNVNV